jgi:membrane protease YdiL (CAAX protease family)
MSRDGAAAGWGALAAFVVTAYALTWACWLPLALARNGLPASAESLATLGQFGPFAAALLVATVRDGRAGLRDLLARIFQLRVHPVWYGIALVLPPALALTAIGAHAAASGADPDVGWSAVTAAVVPQFVYVLLVGGPLGEEPGWRGFALPRLRAAAGPLTATAVLALAWAGWHLPLWWAADVPCSFGFYVFGVIPLTYLFTWLTDRSGGSVPVALVLHASINTCILRLPLFPAFTEWTGLLWLAAAVVYACDRPGDDQKEGGDRVFRPR